MTAVAEDRPVIEVERAAFGTDGTAITQQLLARWRVPLEVLSMLRSPGESLTSRALHWAEYATLAANPAWHALRERAGGGGDAAWLTARCNGAARHLGLSETELAAIEQQNRQRIERMREDVLPTDEPGRFGSASQMGQSRKLPAGHDR
jgi:hypothetical protein